MNKWVIHHYQGILLSLAIAVAAFFLGRLFPIIGGAVFGILIGIVINNAGARPSHTGPGIDFTSKKILQYSIIILGGGLSLTQVWKTGVSSLAVMLITITTAFAAAYLFGKILGVSFNLKSLIGTGTAICGGSAIAAVSPVIEADDHEIAYSISTIFMFNVLAVLIFPFVGHAIGLTQDGFGLWAGTAINDTSSVVAAGYTYGDSAGAYATIVKLTRTTLIIPISLIFALCIFLKKRKEKSEGNVHYSFKKIFPWFILGFIAMSLLNTVGVITPEMAKWANEAGKFMIIMALSAIGLKTDFRRMIKAGWQPLALGLIVWISVAASSLAVQKFTGQL